MTPLPRLELADCSSPFDEAVINIVGFDEDTITIELQDGGALDLADRLIRYVNAYDQVVMTLTAASEILRRAGVETAAAKIDELSKTIGEAA